MFEFLLGHLLHAEQFVAFTIKLQGGHQLKKLGNTSALIKFRLGLASGVHSIMEYAVCS
jgi:hypothetical protein